MGPDVTSHAYDVSGDGSVIVGEVGGHAFRFDRGSSPRLLRELANSTAGTAAHAISDNGEWIVAAALLPGAITSARVGYRWRGGVIQHILPSEGLLQIPSPGDQISASHHVD